MKYATQIWIILSVCTLIFSFAARPNTYALADEGNGNNNNGQNGQGNSTGNNTNEGQGNNNNDGQANTIDEGQVNNTDDGQANDKDDGQVNNNDDGQMNDKDDDRVDDLRELYEKRTLQIENSFTEVTIKSFWERNQLKDSWELYFSTIDSLKLILKYSTQNTTNGSSLEFTLLLDKIIEYNDTNNNGRYDDNDTIISMYDLEKAAFKKITYATETTQENQTAHIISTGTIDGVFGIVLHVVGNFTMMESGIQTPSEVKIDYIINYNYVSNDSKIALKTEINTQYDTETTVESYDAAQGYAHNESDLKILSRNYTGFFSWGEHALIDNISKPVNVTIVQNEGHGSDQKDIIYFSYPRGTHIVHDPKVGVISLSSLTFVAPELIIIPIASVLTYIAAFVAVSVLFVGSIYLRKRM